MMAHADVIDDDSVQELLTREELLDCLRAELQRLAVQLQRDVRAELKSATQELLSKALVSPLDAKTFDADEQQPPARLIVPPREPSKGPPRPSLLVQTSTAMPRRMSKVAFISSSIMDLADEVLDRKDYYGQETDGLSNAPAATSQISFASVRKSIGQAFALPSEDQVAHVDPPHSPLQPVLPHSGEEDSDEKDASSRTQETASRTPCEHETRPVNPNKSAKKVKSDMRHAKSRRRVHPILLQLRDKKGCMDQMRYQVARLLYSPFFEIPVLLLIISNAGFLGVQTDYQAKDLNAKEPSSFRVVDLLYMVLFTLEVVLRLFVHRRGFFTKGEWMWNMFDFVLVLMQFLEEMVLAFSTGLKMQELSEQISSSSGLRVVRIVRAARVIRVMRVLRYASELRLLLVCIVQSYRSFTWAMTILLLMTYIVSIFFTQQATSARAEGAQHEGLQRWYGSVARTVLSLMQGITGGVDWNDLVEPMIEDVSVVTGVLLTAYILFALVAVMNVVLGTFVDSAITRAAEVKTHRERSPSMRSNATCTNQQCRIFSGTLTYIGPKLIPSSAFWMQMELAASASTSSCMAASASRRQPLPWT
eukprot:TRINITY_DN17010_c0_g1_i1.p1 TRINITY_DN17010_c0_g1~~TRINITY_DN17010_c0_g1_i1.p1  ORF type:complete len:590 (+),score=112.03 TRINITY_DN17010_c0_g1_i1:27-1796(+)